MKTGAVEGIMDSELCTEAEAKESVHCAERFTFPTRKSPRAASSEKKKSLI